MGEVRALSKKATIQVAFNHAELVELLSYLEAIKTDDSEQQLKKAKMIVKIGEARITLHERAVEPST